MFEQENKSFLATQAILSCSYIPRISISDAYEVELHSQGDRVFSSLHEREIEVVWLQGIAAR